MKKISFILMLLVASVTVFGQKTNDNKTNNQGKDDKKRTPEQVATDFSNKLVKKAGINDEQKNKVYTLKLKEVQDIRAVKQQSDLKEDAKKQKVKEIVKNFRAELKTVLTPEQMAKLKSEKEEKNDKNKGKKNDKKKKDEKKDDETEDAEEGM